jgi:diguanylate cyclase (GGDEF)-like protein/putative nucleotidyltransferase with HDIG domain
VNQYDLSGYSSQTKVCLGLMAVLSVFALAFATFGLSAFSVANFAALGVSIIIAAIVSQHQAKLWNYRLPFSARKILVIWGILWLGVSGGVILSAASSLASYKLNSKDRGRWFATLFSNILSTFVSAKVLYFLLYNVGSFSSEHFFASEAPVGLLIPAVLLLAVVDFAVYTLAFSLFGKIESESDFVTVLRETAISWSVNYLIGLAGGLALHFAVTFFGLWFGLVLLPTVIFGHVAYRIHIQKLGQKTREITESSRIHLATVEALATAIDARDQVGIGHVRRTQIYAVGIGELLGLSSDEINALRTGALLHDIGKLGVPDHILNKPGRLTPAELEKMKIHATVGAAILEKVKFPYPVVPTVKYHHEAWDGSGYPEGLKKEEIPLTARIIAVADAYDTLRGARPFRESVPREDARRFLLVGSGVQFDPKIVDIFLRNLKQFEVEIEYQGLSYEFDAETSELYMGVDGVAEANQGYVEQIKRANREVFALYELAKVFSASLNLQDTLSLFVKKVGELMPFDTCAVYLLDKDPEYATIQYVEGVNSGALKDKRIKAGEGATGYALRKRQALYNVNPALDFSFDQLESMQSYTAMASLPLIANEKLIGAISLYSCDLESYEDEHMRLLETVSRIASDAISKSLQHAETATHALTDPMTNLPNARSLQLHFENEAARTSRSGSEFQLIMLDLDGFKKVNDTFGHKVGDMLLKEISKVMRAELREYDFLARYAGDEFVAIIPDTTAAAMEELCERMEKAVLGFRLPIGDGRFAQVGVSMGSSSYTGRGETLDQVIIAADQAMYSVKASHKQKNNKPEPTPKAEATVSVEPLEIFESVKVMPQQLKINEESFVLELDESHIVSNAVN